MIMIIVIIIIISVQNDDVKMYINCCTKEIRIHKVKWHHTKHSPSRQQNLPWRHYITSLCVHKNIHKRCRLSSDKNSVLQTTDTMSHAEKQGMEEKWICLTTTCVLTHWGRVTHICVGKLTIIGSDNGLAPDRRQAIIWTNDGKLLIGPIGTNFSEILIEILTFSFKKMHLKVLSAKRRPFCLGLNVLRHMRHLLHYIDVMESQINSNLTACSTTSSDYQQQKHLDAHCWPFVRGIQWWLMDSLKQGQ